MADEGSAFVYADGNPSRRPSNVAPVFTPARVVDARALAGLEFLRRPIPDVRAPHAGAPAFGGSDDHRGGPGDARAPGSAFEGTAPPSGAKRPAAEDRARARAETPGGFPDANRETHGAKRRVMAPIEENKPRERRPARRARARRRPARFRAASTVRPRRSTTPFWTT